MDKLSKCEDVAELLALYHYGELTDAKARMVETHLSGCADCMREFEKTRHTLGLIRPEHPGAAEAARAKAGVMRRIGASRPGPFRRFAPVLAAAAAAAIIALVFNFAGPLTPTGEQPPVRTARTVEPAVTVEPAEPVRTASVDVELLENYDLVSNLDMLENLDTLEEIEEL